MTDKLVDRVPTATSGGIDRVSKSSSHMAVPIELYKGRTQKMKRVMKKMMQIKEDGEDNEEGGENEFHTPFMPTIKELIFAP